MGIILWELLHFEAPWSRVEVSYYRGTCREGNEEILPLRPPTVRVVIRRRTQRMDEVRRDSVRETL